MYLISFICFFSLQITCKMPRVDQCPGSLHLFSHLPQFHLSHHLLLFLCLTRLLQCLALLTVHTTAACRPVYPLWPAVLASQSRFATTHLETMKMLRLCQVILLVVVRVMNKFSKTESSFYFSSILCCLFNKH